MGEIQKKKDNWIYKNMLIPLLFQTDNHPKQELWDSRPKLSAKLRCEIAVLYETDHENNHESAIMCKCECI